MAGRSTDDTDRLGDAIYGLFPDEDADSVKEIRELRRSVDTGKDQ